MFFATVSIYCIHRGSFSQRMIVIRKDTWQLPDVMLQNVCTEVQAINTHIRKSLTATQRRCRKSRFAILSKQWENSKNSWNSGEKNTDLFSLEKKCLVNSWVHQHFFFVTFYIICTIIKIQTKSSQKKTQTILKSIGGDCRSGGSSGIMCKQLF